MSYDIRLAMPDGSTPEIAPHSFAGGTYALGGTTDPWLNITYNYSRAFYRVLGDKGIRTVYGMTARAGALLLRDAAAQLTGEPDLDYWAPTDGNARKALLSLAALADLCPPDAIFEGD